MIFRWLNNNMRCFEIFLNVRLPDPKVLLNNNMRCFEMALTQLKEMTKGVKQ